MAHQPADKKEFLLFGGNKGWHQSDWTASDDRVRGGKSQSHLDCSHHVARFHGTLDIDTLGGAGFASQRTTGEDREWDLSDYEGIEIRIPKGDKKRYTFNLKDELLPTDPKTGREQSTLSYECDFELPPQTKPGDAHDKTIYIPWSAFNATYRGRLKKDAKPIDRKKIKRVSLMMRSFFGSQKGDFSLSIDSIAAVPKAPSAESPVYAVDHALLEKAPGVDVDIDIAAGAGGSRTIFHRNTYLVVGSLALVALYFFSGNVLRVCH